MNANPDYETTQDAATSILREATELQPQQVSGAFQRETLGAAEQHTSRNPPPPQRGRRQMLQSRNLSLLASFQAWTRSRWTRYVSVLILHQEARDHWANERTFLSMLRTSLAFALTGTVITQLLRLQHSPTPNPVFGFYLLGLPLACVCIFCAILVSFLGCVRFMRQQNAIIRQKCLAGGWEIYIVGCLASLTIGLAFVLILTVDVEKG